MTTIRDMTQPPGGWRYKVEETGMSLYAASAASLRGKILSHMAANGIEAPHDINGAICEQMGLGEPYCPGPGRPENAPAKYPKLTIPMANRFMKTMLQVARDRAFVTPAEADRRMATCMICPLATSIGACWHCNGLFSTIGKFIKGSGPAAEEGREWCAACGCRISLKVLIPNETLDKVETDKPDYWTGCWRHTNASNE